MAEEFDAYREWLDIPPERQPPNYYDLKVGGLSNDVGIICVPLGSH